MTKDQYTKFMESVLVRLDGIAEELAKIDRAIRVAKLDIQSDIGNQEIIRQMHEQCK